jgi:predicted DNA-binding ribbon-helix-helix protein
MKSLVVKRSIVIAGHKTSVSLEEPFWLGLKEIAQGQHVTLSNMVGDIDTRRRQGNLSSAIRLFVLDSVRMRVAGFNGTRPAAELVPQGTATNPG